MATVRDQQTSQNRIAHIPHEGGTTEYGQTFTPNENYTLTAVRMRFSYYKAPAGTCYLSVEETTAGLPNGNVITDRVSFECPAEATYIVIDFTTQPDLVNGTKYAIVIEAPNGVVGTPASYDDAERLAIYVYSVNGTQYTRGDIISYDGSWHTTATADCYFQCFGEDGVPIKATNPSPANSATEVDFSAFGLSWDDGGGADTFDVWIGPSGSLVKVSSAQVGTTYTSQLSECPLNQKIYWRIDSINVAGTTTGDTWNFDPRPAQVTSHSPDTDESGWLLNEIAATWDEPSANTTSYSVSYGTLSGFLSVVGTPTERTQDLVDSPFPNYNNFYYYRVDAVNQFGTTQGIEIAFSTLSFKLLGPTYYYNGYYYRLLPGGSPPPGGVEDTDYIVVGNPNFISTTRLLVAIANSKFWYEDI